MVRVISHKETKTLIGEIIKIRDTIEDTKLGPSLPKNKTWTEMAMQMRFFKMLLQQMTICGSLLSQVGEFNLCEECYSLYIALVESIEGNNSLKAA